MTDGVIFKPIIKSIGWHKFVHIPDRRLHDCAQFTCILVLRLHTLPFQYTCIIHYICTNLKFYTSSKQHFLHLHMYDLYRTGEYYLTYIIHSEIKFWFGNMENLSPTEANLAFYMMVFIIESIEKLINWEHGDALKRMQGNMHYWSQWLNGVRRPIRA
jgi:hypothetical protein